MRASEITIVIDIDETGQWYQVDNGSWIWAENISDKHQARAKRNQPPTTFRHHRSGALKCGQRVSFG
jgi:hypothetical protein